MRNARKAVPEPQAILPAWMPFKKLVGVTSVRTEEDYEQVRATIDALLGEVGDNENHPLAEVLYYLADQVKAYEDECATKPHLGYLERQALDQQGNCQAACSPLPRPC